MQIITPSEAVDDLAHKAARLIVDCDLFLSARMNKADSAAVEKETVSAEIFRKSSVERSLAVRRVSDDRVRKMFEMASQLMSSTGSKFEKN